MKRWMNERWVDGWMDSEMGGWMNECFDGWMSVIMKFIILE